MLESGIKAPEFKLEDKDGNLVSLSDFKNKKVVLYFYPRDNTPGCTKQACSFRDNYEKFKSKEGKTYLKLLKQIYKENHIDIDLARQSMGMCFQQFNLFNNYTILDNLILAPV